jgi:hypothetical protein
VLAASVVGTLEADVQDLLVLWANPLWLAYLVFCALFGAGIQTVHVAYNKAQDEGHKLPYSDYVLPITYATFSALFGTLSVVLAKQLSELVTLWLSEGENIFWGPDAWFTYVTLFAWLAFVGVWLFRMNEALSLYDPLFIIPLLQVNFILFAIVSGGIYFKEFSYFKPVNTMGFLAGVVLLVFGIFLLSPKLGDDEDHDHDDDDGTSDAHSDVGSFSGDDVEMSAQKAREKQLQLYNQQAQEQAVGGDDTRNSRGISFASDTTGGGGDDRGVRGSSSSNFEPKKRMSLTKRSIKSQASFSSDTDSDNGRRKSNAANNRRSIINFKFGAVVSVQVVVVVIVLFVD